MQPLRSRRPLKPAKWLAESRSLTASARSRPSCRHRRRRRHQRARSSAAEPPSRPNVNPVETVTEEPPARQQRPRSWRTWPRPWRRRRTRIEVEAEPSPQSRSPRRTTTLHRAGLPPRRRRPRAPTWRPRPPRSCRPRRTRRRGGRDDRARPRPRRVRTPMLDLESEIDRALQEQRGIPPRPRPERTVVRATAIEARPRCRAPRAADVPRAAREPRREFGPSEFNRRQIPERRPLPGSAAVAAPSPRSPARTSSSRSSRSSRSQTLREVQRADEQHGPRRRGPERPPAAASWPCRRSASSSTYRT